MKEVRNYKDIEDRRKDVMRLAAKIEEVLINEKTWLAITALMHVIGIIINSANIPTELKEEARKEIAKLLEATPIIHSGMH